MHWCIFECVILISNNIRVIWVLFFCPQSYIVILYMHIGTIYVYMGGKWVGEHNAIYMIQKYISFEHIRSLSNARTHGENIKLDDMNLFFCTWDMILSYKHTHRAFALVYTIVYVKHYYTIFTCVWYFKYIYLNARRSRESYHNNIVCAICGNVKKVYNILWRNAQSLMENMHMWCAIQQVEHPNVSDELFACLKILCKLCKTWTEHHHIYSI